MKNIFKINQKEIRPGLFTIPKWTKVGKTYNEAVEKALEVLAKERKFYNWREGKLGEKYLRESERKKTLMAKLYEQKGDYVSFSAQLGEKYKDKSVEEARKLMEADEFGLGAYEIACILISHPDILTKGEDLWIDCSGDEYSPGAGGRFDCAPCFSFDGGKVRFDAGWVGDADDDYGSASACLPQSKIEPLKAFNLSDIEIKIGGKKYKLAEK